MNKLLLASSLLSVLSFSALAAENVELNKNSPAVADSASPKVDNKVEDKPKEEKEKPKHKGKHKKHDHKHKKHEHKHKKDAPKENMSDKKSDAPDDANKDKKN
ncbi:MAG: hypothetical protein K9G11_00780 [Rickettsiaceae bacterium]|nr:hypothetical protein [Rickettsiaceae bacterium]